MRRASLATCRRRGVTPFIMLLLCLNEPGVVSNVVVKWVRCGEVSRGCAVECEPQSYGTLAPASIDHIVCIKARWAGDLIEYLQSDADKFPLYFARNHPKMVRR